MKRVLIGISMLSFGVAIAGWIAWQRLLLIGSGDHGEQWETWHARIDLIWQIIPAAFLVSIAAGIAGLVLKPRSRSATIVATLTIVAAVAVAAWFSLVLSQLRIR